MHQPNIFTFVNREVRHVPLDWQHPVDEYGSPIPLSDRTGLTEEDSIDLMAEGEDIDKTYMPDFSAVPKERMGIQAYQTTGITTPLYVY